MAMATAAKRKTKSKLTVSAILKSLNATGEYDYPKDLEGFYKLATSELMMNHVTVSGAFTKTGKAAELKKIICAKEERDSKGKTKKNSYSPKQLKDIAENLLEDEVSQELFLSGFKRLTLHYFKGQFLLTEKQYLKLNKIYEEFLEPESLHKEILKFINQLPDQSICIIAHLIFLGKIFIETNEVSVNSNCHDTVVPHFFHIFNQIVYLKSYPEAAPSDKIQIALQFNPVKQMVYDIWRLNLDFIPISNQTLPAILRSLKKTKKYQYPSELEAFYKMASSNKMNEFLPKEGFLRKVTNSVNKFIKNKTQPGQDGTIAYNKLSPEELNKFAEKALNIPDDHVLFGQVFKRIIEYYSNEFTILDHKQYEKLQLLYKNATTAKDKVDAMLTFINSLPQISICIIAHLTYLAVPFMKTNESFANDRNHDNAMNNVFTSIFVNVYIHHGDLIMAKKLAGEEPRYEPLEQLLLHLWKEVLDFTPKFSDAGRQKYTIVNEESKIIRILKCLQNSEKCDYPSDLEAFALMATSDRMKVGLSDKDVFTKNGSEKVLDKFVLQKEKADKKGKVKRTEYSPKQLTKLVKDFLKKETGTIHDYMDLFKRVTQHYFTENSVLERNHLSKLNEIFTTDTDLNTRTNEMMQFTNKLPDKSNYVLAHLIYLAFLYLTTNQLFSKDRNQDNAMICTFRLGIMPLINNEVGASLSLKNFIVRCWKDGLNFNPKLSEEMQKKFM